MEDVADDTIKLKIEGELGKNNTIPISTFVKIAQSLQKLVLSIAKTSIPSNELDDLGKFNLELSGFEKGSVVPSFIFPNTVSQTTTPYHAQKKLVADDLRKLMSLSDSGNYYGLRDLYKDPSERNQIVESLYDFRSSFGSSPVSMSIGSNSIKYRLKKFSAEAKKSLISNTFKSDNEKTEEDVPGMVRITTNKVGHTVRRIQETYSKDNHALSYSPEIISVNGKTYTLVYPIRCSLEKEEDYFVVEHEQLDIIGTGLTQSDAEVSFNEEFDFLYRQLNSLEDNQLSKRLRFIKLALNNFVKDVQ
jgi:hypothetical protein